MERRILFLCVSAPEGKSTLSKGKMLNSINLHELKKALLDHKL